MSFEWIEQHGLKAKKLNLYQVLAPNAYSYMEDYVPILNKTVQSQVHEVLRYIYILIKYRLVNFEPDDFKILQKKNITNRYFKSDS